MDNERIKEVFSDEAFLTEFLSLENPEDVQALLKTKGFDVDLDQICKLAAFLDEKLGAMETAEGELDEDELEEVAGGWGMLVGTVVMTIITGGLKYISWKTGRRW